MRTFCAARGSIRPVFQAPRLFVSPPHADQHPLIMPANAARYHKNLFRSSASTITKDDGRAHTKRRMAAFSFLGTKRARAPAIRLVLLYANTVTAVLLRLVGASTSLPSSSSELCPDETAACYDSPFCWDCVAQFADSPNFCEELYPVLAVDAGAGAADECEIASALHCCSFDASGQDCLGDAVTVDFFRCGLLEGSGCALSDPPCSGVSGTTLSSGTDVSPPTPAPAPAVLPPTAPSTISPTETITITVPSPVENGPLPSTPSPIDVDRDAVVTGGAAGGVTAPWRSLEQAASWSSYYCYVVWLVAGWTAVASMAAVL